MARIMSDVMNVPVIYDYTDDDIIREYSQCQDKKKIAKIYCMTVKEVTEILRQGKDNKIDIMSDEEKKKELKTGDSCDVTMDEPNADTIAAMEDSKKGINLSREFDTVKELMEDLFTCKETRKD